MVKKKVVKKKVVKKKVVKKKKLATPKGVPRTKKVTRGKKKVMKKKLVKKVVKKRSVKKKVVKKVVKKVAEKKEKLGKEIGRVSGYFSHVGVAAIKLSGGVKVGDKVHIKGHTTDFKVTVKSMQIEGKNVAKAKKGDHIGIKVKGKVRPNDAVLLE